MPFCSSRRRSELCNRARVIRRARPLRSCDTDHASPRAGCLARAEQRNATNRRAPRSTVKLRGNRRLLLPFRVRPRAGQSQRLGAQSPFRSGPAREALEPQTVGRNWRLNRLFLPTDSRTLNERRFLNRRSRRGRVIRREPTLTFLRHRSRSTLIRGVARERPFSAAVPGTAAHRRTRGTATTRERDTRGDS